MKLLISNDDGIFATGIRTLANTLASKGHDVSVVCPDRERSATGHGITMHRPIRAEQVPSVYHESIQAWACSGTPADCVKLALDALLDTAPDCVLSGINHGANLGNDVLYSGTVSAAMEGLLEGIPSVALSLASFHYSDFQPAADYACQLVQTLTQLDQPLLLNLNIPPITKSKIQGITVTRLGIRRYRDLFEKRIDPRGKTYYWLAGEVLEESDSELSHGLPNSLNQAQTIDFMNRFTTDVKAIKAGYITVTPLHYDLTAYSDLASLQSHLPQLLPC
ncbi:5'/3'-nucleotidase SurE [Leptolyngbyaceae cyanobacterium CCMR0082]|uniref:5'-nucleotidase SurE n=1 Tax=Adonisia turfae CCMR0082 TaxID=2304604 RepID=A0A6M0S3C9_9CYAN|nr:5'/3'-nucleotidase SurE [Adonisia turfae]MDV3349386.1 5'/3'-nucleotidase SurE [Leptothoe sp. LEGE 181152]NEZ62800.1 5'/3'-nucleotidase SurE [Adonisia turfae CCMR0082]